MPMLHGCAVPGCDTLTLSTYCLEHELLIRAEIEAERVPYQVPDEAGTPEPTAPQATA